jgi:hypothetical protein
MLKSASDFFFFTVIFDAFYYVADCTLSQRDFSQFLSNVSQPGRCVFNKNFARSLSAIYGKGRDIQRFIPTPYFSTGLMWQIPTLFREWHLNLLAVPLLHQKLLSNVMHINTSNLPLLSQENYTEAKEL